MKRLLYSLIALLVLITATALYTAAAESTDNYFSRDGGVTVNALDRLIMKEKITEIPTTFEMTVKFSKNTDKSSVLFGNYNDAPTYRPSTLMYYVEKSGVPVLYIRDKSDKTFKYSFSKAKLYTGEFVNLAIVIDGDEVHCYLDGVLKQSLAYTAIPKENFTPSTAMIVGGDYRSRVETSGGEPTGRSGKNYAYCLGVIKDLALYSDTRSASEVASDMTSRNTADAGLLAYYDLTYAQNANIIPDASAKSNTLYRELADGGLTFEQGDSYTASGALKSIPETIEAVFMMPEGFTGRGGIIYSNYAGQGGLTNMCLHLQSNNQLRLWYENKTNLDDRVYFDVIADMDIPSGEWVQVAVTRDLAKSEWRFYLNGKLADTVKFSEFTENQITAMKAVTADHAFKIGNDYRKDQTIYFKGTLKSVTVYSDVRTDAELFKSVAAGPEKDSSLLAYYDMSFADGATIPDRSQNGIDVTNTAYSGEESGDGMTFSMSNKYVEKYKSNTFPHTIEATLKLPVGDYGHRAIVSNYDPADKTSAYQLRTVNGVPRLTLYTPSGASLEYRFTKLTADELCTGEYEHLTFVMDTDAREFRVYLNGVLEDTKKFNNPQTLNLTVEEIDALDFDFLLGRPLMVGRNYATTEQYGFPFTGQIKSIVTYSDVRSADEISADMVYPEADGSLTGYYVFEGIGARKHITDKSNARNDLIASDGDTVMYSAETLGMVFDNQYFYETYNKFDETPLTFEAVVKLPSTGNGGSDKVIIGNYYCPTSANTLNFEIKGTVCHPEIYVIDRYGDEYVFTFDKVTASTDYWEHIAITFDKEAGYAYCYQNGLLMQKLEYNGELDGIDWDDCKYPHILGGDWQSADFGKFNRRMAYAALYTSTRSAEEIYADARDGIDTSDEDLYVYYDCMAATADGNKKPEVITDGKDGKFDAHYFYPFFDKEDKDPSSYDYSFAVVGDTQLINERYPDIYAGLYDWIIANADAKKIEFVLGLGDICQNDIDAEWERAAAALSKLRDAGIPQSIVCGSYHDSIPQYNKYLPYKDYVDAYKGQIEYGFYDNGKGELSLANAYHLFTVGETKYMVLTLDFGPGTAIVNWANEVIAAHPDYNVIVTTHGYLYLDGTHFSTYDYPSPDSTGKKDAHNGDELWDALIRKHENIVMTLSGHAALDRIVKTVSYGDHGNRIVEMLINPQETDTNYKGTGLVAMLYFSDGGKSVDLEYYSTDKLQYFYECNQFSFDMPMVGGDEASINQASVSLGNGISVNYYARLTGKYTSAKMRFTVNGKSVTVSPKATDSSGKYLFVYNAITPELIGEEIRAELILGNEVIDTADVFTVEGYVKGLLKSDKFELTYSDRKCASLRAMLTELLNYCAETQKALGYTSGGLVNEGILETSAVFNPDEVESAEAYGTPSGEQGAKILSAGARIDGKVYLEFKINIGTASISDVTVEIGDKVYSGTDLTYSDGAYVLMSEPVSALELDKVITAALKVSGNKVHEASYSVNSYVKSAYGEGDLVKALYLYGAAASAYAFGAVK